MIEDIVDRVALERAAHQFQQTKGAGYLDLQGLDTRQHQMQITVIQVAVQATPATDELLIVFAQSPMTVARDKEIEERKTNRCFAPMGNRQQV